MDEETKKLILENTEIVRKTLEVTQRIEKRLFWQRALKTAKWVIIIALTALGFWQIQPYIDPILGLYQNLFGVLGQTQNLQQNFPADLQKLLVQ